MEFDARAKEAELATEAESWDTSSPRPARPGEIPIVDVSAWCAEVGGPEADEGGAVGDDSRLERVAAELREACETVGFFQMIGHPIEPSVVAGAFEAAARFSELPTETKLEIAVDKPGSPAGVGYLPFGERRLPRRAKGNLNEAFMLKVDRSLRLDGNQWPAEEVLPGFRAAVEVYLDAALTTARMLVSVYERALELAPGFFDAAFSDPLWRFRLTHYPSIGKRASDEYGIAPHVDTTFFTLLAQGSPGLVIHSPSADEWLEVPQVEGALVVNTGELLRQWSNDRFVSVKHFANNNTGSGSRYSIPLFFNANAEYPMECLPTCHSPGNPPKYPTISYLESQGVVQGE